MGLPQELIDYIMGMLRDDIPALKACSLTCKSMFASTRHLIHRILYLHPETSRRVYKQDSGYPIPFFKVPNIEKLRHLCGMDEHGVLKYARRVHFIATGICLPEALLPYHHHFQSLDQVHTLRIDYLDASAWAPPDLITCFAHFYPTLTSLSLLCPGDHYLPLVGFITQFPNLDNLCLEWMTTNWRVMPAPSGRFVVDRSPPFRGHLRLVGCDTVILWLATLFHGILDGVNFRSVELRDFFWDYSQYILDPCSRTLEDLTIGAYVTNGTRSPSFLRLAIGERLAKLPLTERPQWELSLTFTRLRVLRRLTLCMNFSVVPTFERDPFLATLSTITSPLYSELVIELDRPRFDKSPLEHWGHWEAIDEFIAENFAQREDFRLIIRPNRLYDQENFQSNAMKSFRLSAKKGCVHFEMPGN